MHGDQNDGPCVSPEVEALSLSYRTPCLHPSERQASHVQEATVRALMREFIGKPGGHVATLIRTRIRCMHAWLRAVPHAIRSRFEESDDQAMCQHRDRR